MVYRLTLGPSKTIVFYDGFVTDSDPYASKSKSDGILRELFSLRIFWRAPHPAIMSKMKRNIWGFGSGLVGILRIFLIFPGIIRNGSPGPWDYYLGPWDYYLGVWGTSLTCKLISVHRTGIGLVWL